MSRSFEGPIAVTDADECEFEVPNLARLTTNDSGTTVDDQTLVRVERTDCELPGAVAIELDAEGALSRRFPWTIEKSVTPEHADRLRKELAAWTVRTYSESDSRPAVEIDAKTRRQLEALGYAVDAGDRLE